jgi:4-methyl-5(b-hydroxyethyl)-thiazole monophosphate biosynthesis
VRCGCGLRAVRCADVVSCGCAGAAALLCCAAASAPLVDLLRHQKAAGRVIAAICASPAVVFAKHGLITAAEPATCYPSFADRMPNSEKLEDDVVVTHNVITSRGPGTTIPFALTIVKQLCGGPAADSVAKGLLSHWRA